MTRKKLLLFVLVFGLVFTLSACKKEEQKTEKETEKQEEQQEEKGFIDNIKDALTKGRKMECTTTFTEDGQEFTSKSYVQGEKFKSINEIEGKKFYTLFDGEAFYSWAEGVGQGTKISQDCMKEIEEMSKDLAEDQEPVDEEQYKTPEEWLEEPDVDVKCKPVLSIDFSKPGNVNFVDQCQMLKNTIESVKKMQENMQNFNFNPNP